MTHDHAVQCVHDPVLVALSYLVSVLGSYTALQLAIGIPAAVDARARWRAVVAAGAAMGGGAIWAMHFIAMLACTMAIPVTYDLSLTALSALIGMASCMAGLAIAGSGVFEWTKTILGGVFMGVGVAGMHYTGMAAMRMPAVTGYDMNIVALSVLIAIVASIAALWLAFNMRGVAQMFGSALVMGVAVCGMHYTAMQAASFTPTGENPAVAADGIGGGYLGATIFVVATVLLGTVLAISLLRQQRRTLVRI